VAYFWGGNGNEKLGFSNKTQTVKTSMSETDNKVAWTKRIQQLGVGAFLFFLIKGLIWLAIFFGLGTWIKSFF